MKEKKKERKKKRGYEKNEPREGMGRMAGLERAS